MPNVVLFVTSLGALEASVGAPNYKDLIIGAAFGLVVSLLAAWVVVFWTRRCLWKEVTCPPKPDPGVMRVSTGPQAQEMTLDETQATQSRPDHPEVA